MRVGLTVEQCWRASPGGTASSAVNLARGLAGLDADLDLVGLAAFHRRPPTTGALPVTVARTAAPRLLLQELWHRWRWPAVERSAGRLDVVHATSGPIPATRSPLVVTVHDLAWRHDPTHFTPRGVAFFERALGITLDEAALVVVPSEATAVDCRAAGVEEERLQVIPWGAEQRRGDPSAARTRWALPERFVLFVGTDEPRKNLARLVEAMAELGPAAPPLVLAGPPGWGPGVEGQLERHAIEHRHLGFVAQEHLADLYAAATVVAYPSIREGFGLPVLEAMVQGAAVVTSSTTSTAEVAGDAAVLVDPLDVDTIAGGIAGLLADEPRRVALGEAAAARATEFTWSSCAEAHLAVYRSVLHLQGRPS